MAETGEFEVKDYGLFSNCISLTNTATDAIELDQTIIKDSKTILSDASVFMGPLCDSTISAIEVVEKHINILKDNFATIAEYMKNASSTYQEGDKSSEQVLNLNQSTGKIEVRTGIFGSDYVAPKKLDDYQYDFINTIKDYALEVYYETGVVPSLIIAQAIHESGWGKKAIDGNIFGIKAGKGYTGTSTNTATQEFENGQYITINDDFRTYTPERLEGETDEEYEKRQWYNSTKDYGDLMQNADGDRYREVRAATNYKDAAYAIKKAGYATGEHYAEHIIDTVEIYDLAQWDPTPEQKEKDYAELMAKS